MSTHDNGGAAFPMFGVDTGMTLRDYFAAKAMQGLVPSDVFKEHEVLAERAYLIADAMIAQSKKGTAP